MLTESFSRLSIDICSVFAAFSVIFLTVSVFALMKSLFLRKFVFALTSAFSLCGEFVFYHVALDVMHENNPPLRDHTVFLAPLPFWLIILIASLFYILTVVSLIFCRNSEKNTVGPNSIRDGIDCMTEGGRLLPPISPALTRQEKSLSTATTSSRI